MEESKGTYRSWQPKIKERKNKKSKIKLKYFIHLIKKGWSIKLLAAYFWPVENRKKGSEKKNQCGSLRQKWEGLVGGKEIESMMDDQTLNIIK